jgi:hypothetical protein
MRSIAILNSRKPILKPCIFYAEATLPFSLKGSPERFRGRVLIFSRQLALNHIAPKKTVKISTFCKVITSCQQGTYRSWNYLQLTIVGQRRSDWQFFKTSPSCRAIAQRRRISLQPFL